MNHTDIGGLDLSTVDLRDAVDLAIGIERAAHDRYRELSARVGGRYEGDADHVFRTMAELEANHAAYLADRRRRVFGDAPPRIDPTAVLDVEAPDPSAIRVFMGPREALQVALESEKRAFDFYDEAARLARDPAARVFFEEQRSDEADHCRALDAWMRTAPAGPDLDDDEADPPGSDAA
jgi:rubrerythrin